MAPLALLALILYPAFDYASEERFIVTPALEISNAWRAAAIPVGIDADGADRRAPAGAVSRAAR